MFEVTQSGEIKYQGRVVMRCKDRLAAVTYLGRHKNVQFWCE
jgi:hypothetical protein